MTKKKEEIMKDKGFCVMQLDTSCKKKSGVLPLTSFHVNTSRELIGTSHLPICKKCIKKYIYIDNKIDLKRFKKVLRMLDIPFIYKVYENALNSEKETFGVYKQQYELNLSDKNWDDSDMEEEERNTELSTLSSGSKITISKELKYKWGNGLSPEDYEFLEECYNDWIIANGEQTSQSEQDTIIDLCHINLNLRRARAEGNPTDKLQTQKINLLKSAGLTAKDIASKNEANNKKILGVRIAEIESTRPCEYFQDKKIYDDYDGLWEYFRRFILRPMKNLLLGSRDFDKEYKFIEDDKFELDKLPEDGGR